MIYVLVAILVVLLLALAVLAVRRHAGEIEEALGFIEREHLLHERGIRAKPAKRKKSQR